MRPWRSGVFRFAFVAAWVSTGLPAIVPVYKAYRVIGWYPLWLAYPLFAWNLMARHLGITTLLALVVWAGQSAELWHRAGTHGPRDKSLRASAITH